MKRRGLAGALALVWSVTLPAAADDPGAAEALFQKAKTLKEQGKVAEACPLFEESYRLDPAPGTLLNMAACSRLAGKTATAWGQFIEAGRAFRRKNDARRAEFAEQQAKEVEPLLAHVVLKAAKPVAGLVVKRDGAVLTSSSFDTPMPVDPGSHEVVAEAPGFAKVTLKLEAVARTTTEWVIPELTVAAARDTSGSGSGATQRIAGFVVGGAGLAGLVTGVVFLGLTAARSGELEELCPNQRCATADAQAALNEAELFANLANGLLIAGGVVAATGLVVVLTAPSDESAQVSVQASPAGARLSVRF